MLRLPQTTLLNVKIATLHILWLWSCRQRSLLEQARSAWSVLEQEVLASSFQNLVNSCQNLVSNSENLEASKEPDSCCSTPPLSSSGVCANFSHSPISIWFWWHLIQYEKVSGKLFQEIERNRLRFGWAEKTRVDPIVDPQKIDLIVNRQNVDPIVNPQKIDRRAIRYSVIQWYIDSQFW